MTVSDIQRKLAELGLYTGKIDGDAGPLTLKAIAAALGVKETTAPAGLVTDEPLWLTFARKELGVHEGAGALNAPRVVRYYAEAGHVEIHSDDVPWCAAFVGAMLKRAGQQPTGDLMARSYLKWGVKLDKPRLGCIVVFRRGAPPSGHVAFYLGGSEGGVEVLGGNQGDAVTIRRFTKESVLGYRWPA